MRDSSPNHCYRAQVDRTTSTAQAISARALTARRLQFIIGCDGAVCDCIAIHEVRDAKQAAAETAQDACNYTEAGL